MELETVDEPIELGSDAAGAFGFMRTAGRTEAMGNLERMLAAHDTGDGVLLGTSAWLITATRA